VGDFEAPRMLDRIHELFGPLEARALPAPFYRPEPPQHGERRVTLEGPGSTSYFQAAYRVPGAAEGDFSALTVLATILSGPSGMNMFSASPPNRTSRLYQALVERELAASASGAYTPTLDPYLYRVAATVRGGRTGAAVEDVFDAEMERIRREPVTAAELARAIKQTKAQFAYSSESVTNQGFWLGYAAVVADTDWFETFLDRVEAVTVEEVQRVANEYLSPSNRTVGHYLGQARAAAGAHSQEESK
jgi:zinc protease